MLRRALGSPTLFAIVYTSVASAIYFTLGVVAEQRARAHAGRLPRRRPVLRRDDDDLRRGRVAAPGARGLDGVRALRVQRAVVVRRRLGDPARLPHPHRGHRVHDDRLRRRFWATLGEGVPETCSSRWRSSLYVAVRNVLGFSPTRARPDPAARRRRPRAAAADHRHRPRRRRSTSRADRDQVDLGTTPEWDELLFALTLATVAFTSLESASGLGGRGRGRAARAQAARDEHGGDGHRHLRRDGARRAQRAAGRRRRDRARDDVPRAPADRRRRAVRAASGWPTRCATSSACSAAMTLVAAAQSAMLGLSRLAYSLATNRQIPSASGGCTRRARRRTSSSSIAAVLAGALALSKDLEFLVGIYAFGALLAFTIAHVSIIRLRITEPDRPRPYRMPFNVRVPAASTGRCRRWSARVARPSRSSCCSCSTRARATSASAGWCSASRSTSSTARARTSRCSSASQVPEAALRREPREVQYGSILVPLSGDDARRRHRPDRRAPGVRRAARRGRPRRRDRDDRGAVGLRGADGAADRRAAARRAARARARGAAAREGGGGGVRGRPGRDRDGPRAAGRAGDRRGGAAARGRGDRARRRGADAGPRRRAARRPRRRAQRGVRGRRHEVRRARRRPAG